MRFTVRLRSLCCVWGAVALLAISTEVQAGQALTLANSNVNQAFLANEALTVPLNPNGQFSYGYLIDNNFNPAIPASTSDFTGLSFVEFTLAQHTDAFVGSTKIEGYRVNNNASVPAIVANVDPNNARPTTYGITVQPGQLILHPGGVSPDAYAPPIAYADLRYTNLVAGNYAISQTFSSLHGGRTDVHLLINGISVYNGNLTGNGSSETSGWSGYLGVNDRVDFLVGPSTDGIGSDSTGLFANIVATPEPSTLVSACAGGLVLFGAARRRNRQNSAR